MPRPSRENPDNFLTEEDVDDLFDLGGILQRLQLDRGVALRLLEKLGPGEVYAPHFRGAAYEAANTLADFSRALQDDLIAPLLGTLDRRDQLKSEGREGKTRSRPKRESHEEKREKTKSAKSKRAAKKTSKPRSTDPETLPGAIRGILAQHKDGLLTREIHAEVLKVRPKTAMVHVSATLVQMVKRGEVARNGFHRNFKYTLIPQQQNGASDVAPNVTPAAK